jgi:hypothetical protein
VPDELRFSAEEAELLMEGVGHVLPAPVIAMVHGSVWGAHASW